jgi:hypothetical protein
VRDLDDFRALLDRLTKVIGVAHIQSSFVLKSFVNRPAELLAPGETAKPRSVAEASHRLHRRIQLCRQGQNPCAASHYEYLCIFSPSEPDRFILNPIGHMLD